MFIRDVLEAFARHGVDVCLVGGVAVNLHGIPRMTYDVDIVVAMSTEQLTKTHAALLDLGLSCRLPLRIADLADKNLRQQLRDERNLIAVTYLDLSNPLREVDVLVCPPVEPDVILKNAVVLSLDGFPVRVASLQDLIAMKRVTGRAQDDADVAHLERIAGEQAHGRS